MNNNLLQLKIKQRLNKLSSNDYDSFECWMVVEAFNKIQNEFVRDDARKAETDKENTDDLQKVLIQIPLVGYNQPNFFESVELPKNYFAGKRVSAKAVTNECIKGKMLTIYEGEEANLDTLLLDENKNPNFEWGETFKTHLNNRIRIHTSSRFKIIEPVLVYYRQPRQIAFDGCVNEYDEVTSNIECEFNDGLVEKLIDRTAALLAGDTENFNQYQRLQKNPQ